MAVVLFSFSRFDRQNQQRALASVQASLEAEVKAKLEAIRHKKKLEADLCSLEQSLAEAHKANAEAANKAIKMSQRASELEGQLVDEQNQKLEANEAALASERRANALTSQLDEKVGELRLAEKRLAALDMELGEAQERGEEMGRLNAAMLTQKRKMEADNRLMKGRSTQRLEVGSEDSRGIVYYWYRMRGWTN